MLLNLLKAERLKLKRSPIWIAFLLLPIIPAVLGTLNYMNNLDILTSEWYSLWTQHTLFTDYFFLPIMLGIYCSYIMYEEEKNCNWNKVLTMPVSRSMVFLSKLILTGIVLFFSMIWICCLYVLSGKIIGMTAPVPWNRVVVWCVCGTLGGTVMIDIQLMISLFIRNFALPVGISLAAGLSAILFLAKDLGHIWPYSLMAYGMNSNAPQELMESGYPQFVMICMVYIALFTFLSSVFLSKKDI